MGRPTKYRKAYCKAIIDFFNVEAAKTIKKTVTTSKGTVIEESIEVAGDFPTIEKFASNLGVDTATVVNWTKNYPEFFAAYTRAKEMQKDILIRNGLKGLYSGPFAIFVGTNLFPESLKQKQEIEHTGTDGGAIEFTNLERAARLMWIMEQAKKRRLEANGQTPKLGL